MKSYKSYRFETNPTEKVFHDNFKNIFEKEQESRGMLSGVIFGRDGNTPIQHLTETEENVCLNIIQWLGSPVGHAFLESCGYEKMANK